MPTMDSSPDIDYLASAAPPASPQLEEAVLGASLIEDEALFTALEQLRAEDFSQTENALIFQAMRDLFEDNTSMDVSLVADRLRNQGQLEAVGGVSYISGLTRSMSSSTHTADQCKEIIQKRKRRDAIEGFQRLLTLASDSSVDFNDVMSGADDIVFNLLSDDRSGNTSQSQEYISDALEQILSRQGSKDGVTGIGTGLDIDKITAGWQNKEFIVIAARPSMGKTAFVLQSMKHAARKYGAAGLISLEMSNTGLGERLIINEAQVNGQRSRTGQLYENELEKVHEAAERLFDMGLILDDTTFIDAARLRAKARSMIHKYDIKVLAVDYVQLLTSDKDKREQQVAEVSRTCKAIAKEYNIPVVGLSQLNRSCEYRTGWKMRPQLSDLRESGAIEQDADVVGFLFRPMYYDLKEYPEKEGRWGGESTQNVCEIIISKNRNGMTGLKRLGFEDSQTRFYNLQPENGVRKAMKKAKEQKEKFGDPDLPF